jgi:hypothetical protein
VVVTFEHLVSLPLIHVEHASHSSSLKNIYYNDAKFERSATLHPTAADRLASTHTESNFSSALFSSLLFSGKEWPSPPSEKEKGYQFKTACWVTIKVQERHR